MKHQSNPYIEYNISFVTFIIPIIGMLAGLSLAVIIPIFFILTLYSIKDKIEVDIKNIKLEIAFFILLFISILWSTKKVSSFISFFSVISIFIGSLLLITNVEKISNKLILSYKKLSVIIYSAIILFFFEFLTNGFINSLFRKTAQKNYDNYQFYLHNLDRGCSILSLFAWIVIASLLIRKKRLFAAIIYLSVLITLFLSDNLAAFVGYTIGGIVFLFTSYSFFANPKVLSILLILCSFVFIGITFTVNPYYISNKAEFLPISAKHRLFIWEYSAEKIIEKPIFGWGHGASRAFDIKADENIEYNGHTLHPLPTHPHNNIIQIMLENGIVGLALYLALIIKYLFVWNKFSQSQLSNNHINEIINYRACGYACFCSFFIISMISFNMWQSWWLSSYLWTALMISMAAKQNITTLNS